MKKIEVWSNGQLRTDNSIFFKSEGRDKVYLHFQGKRTELATSEKDNFQQGEFMVSLAGPYEISTGTEVQEFVVQPYERISFAWELSLTFVAVLLFFIVFIKKRKRANV